MLDVQRIKERVIEDLAYKKQCKMESLEERHDASELAGLTDAEIEMKCFRDAKADLIESLKNKDKFFSGETGKEEFCSFYYDAYYNIGGKEAVKKAIEIVRKIGAEKV